MKHVGRICAVSSLLVFSAASEASLGLRGAAVSLERQFDASKARGATQTFALPLEGGSVVLSGEVKLESLGAGRCRRILELVHDHPFERRGLRITNLSRRSVQDGPCHNFADAMVAQADASARNIAEQVGIATSGTDSIPGQRMQVADTDNEASRQGEPASEGSPVTLTVLEKAIIRDAPSKLGEKLSRADSGTRLKAQRIAGNPEWFALDGGMRFISATVVDVSDGATASAPARGDNSRVRLRVVERAVLRNAPSFKGQKVASLAAGVERLARKVPGMVGWFELTDSDSRYPLYIHESVVAERPSEKRL